MNHVLVVAGLIGCVSLLYGTSDDAALATARHNAWCAISTLHRVDAVCPHCDRWRELDLAAIVAAGVGDVPLIKLPLRCSACGELGHEIKVSGRSYGLAE